MAGYSRQSVADIIANAVIKAAPVNAEYNAIRDAFAFATGHKHDGSSTEGAYVPLIADTDALNKVVVDTANNRIGIFTEVSAAAVEQVRFQDGAIVPVTDNDIDLGASGTKFKNLYVNGIASIGSITLSGGTIDDTVIGGTTPNAGTFTTLTATTVDLNGGNIDGTIIGATTPAAADFTTMDASGNATIGGTLGVTGVTTLGTANITSVDLDSGAIDNTTIGAATPAAGTFTTLTANTSLTAATADINGGTLDGVVIGGTSSAAATVTDLTATGTSTLTTVDINGGAIDGTTIGASSAAAGSFTTVSTSGQATLATADINGGTVDNTVIGATTPAAITGTTITGTSFVGPVTGNVTGNLTGDVTGDLTGDVTGNITSSGSSSFNNVIIDGTLNMNAGTTATITNLTSPTNTNDAATKGYVDTSIANLVDSAPGTLDTLNELAAALDDDPNFSTTITNSIATKLPLAGGTMTGAIAMSTNKITGLGDPTAAQDAMTKAYADATYLALSGGTMTGAIDMGSQKITTTYTPTNAADLTTKTYVDTILGSGEDAVAAAAAAATSEANAATSETNAANSATAAASSATSAAASYDSFDDRYLGAKATAPTVDNDGDALINGALYFNTTTNIMYVYGSSGWQAAGSSVNGTSDRQTYTATAGQTVFAATYDAGYVDVYLNGVKLLAGTDFTATNGTSITLASGAAVNDIVDIVAYGTFVLADHLTETQSDAKYVEVAGDTMTGDLDITGTLTSDGLTVDGTATITTTGNETQLTLTSTDADATTGPNMAFFRNSSSAADGDQTGSVFFIGKDDAGNDTTYGSLTSHIVDASNTTEDGRVTLSSMKAGTLTDTLHVVSGSVGIGTSSPGQTLHLNSGGTASYMQMTAGTLNGYIGQQDNGEMRLVTAGGSTFMTFQTEGTEAMRIDSSGNVGIGTSSPDNNSGYTALTLSNTTGSGGGQVYVKASSAVGVFGADNASSGTNAKVILQTNTSHPLSFGTSGTERMRIDSSGNVGIGTSSPAAMLDIQTPNAGGDIRLTATDGSSGAQARFTTAAGNFYVGLDTTSGGSFGAANHAVLWHGGAYGITFATNNSRRMTIDSSGNLLVGQTTASSTDVGVSARSNGVLIATADGSNSALFNRKTSDGDIALFRKDGTTVGSIGSQGGDSLTIGNGDTGLLISAANDVIHPWNTSTNAARDNAIDLGRSSHRFKDLYLSGGVYLGGTGSANLLDDYEEGTWTPVIQGAGTNGSYTYSGFASYTKIGRMVTVFVNLDSITQVSAGTSYIQIAGLPFTKKANCIATAAIDYRNLELGGSNTDCVVEFITSTGSSNILYLRGKADNYSGIDVQISGITSGSTFLGFNISYEVA